jgi:hypothetical protein
VLSEVSSTILMKVPMWLPAVPLVMVFRWRLPNWKPEPVELVMVRSV